MFILPSTTDIVARALAEDLGVDAGRFLSAERFGPDILSSDVTTSATIDADSQLCAKVVAREACVVCGLPVAAAVFEMLSDAAGLFEPVDFFPLVAEGRRVEAGTPVAEVEGLAQVVLSAERAALDFLMVLSGMATETRAWVEIAGEGLAVCDTRKTLPGMRELSKYAVRVGGGTNHRTGLHDMLLVKDNHLAAAGSIDTAIRQARDKYPDLPLEVEADTVDQAVSAVRGRADMVLLDNMDDNALAIAVAACRQAASEAGYHVLLEVSGKVDRERLRTLRDAGVDRVSSSALTLARPVDFALDLA